MTNRIAFFLALLIVIGLVLDFIYQHGDGTLFLLRKLSAAIEWLAFWR